jgi:hypothetical protein
MLKISNKIVLGGFPRMSMQKFNGIMMLDPIDKKKKTSNKKGKKADGSKKKK